MRTTKKTVIAVTRQSAEEALAQYATNFSKLKALEAKKELKKQQVDEHHKEEVAQLQEEMDECSDVLEAYAQENHKRWEGKSQALTNGTIGFRTATPAVVKDKKFSWKAVLELVQEHFPQFIRNKEELNKEAIIAARETEEFAKIRKACKLDVEQAETFYIKTKEEDLQPA